MKIKELYQREQPVISLEIFPPKKEAGLATVYQMLADIQEVKPAFISVTYGAGGSQATAETLAISKTVKETYGIEPLHHLTCVGKNQEELAEILSGIKEEKIENILALRGDLPVKEKRGTADFQRASELISFLTEQGDFSIGGACYPEGHISQLTAFENMEHLKAKEAAGADFFNYKGKIKVNIHPLCGWIFTYAYIKVSEHFRK